MLTTLILIRHAQTDSNIAGPNPLMSGWTDSPLNRAGHEQLECLRARFRNESAIAAVYSSPLTRARETAASIAQVYAKTVELLDDLREINCGEVDGQPIELVKKSDAERWERNLLQEDDDFRWPAGESYRELRERSLRVIRHIAARHVGECVAVVTHAGVISQILGALHGYRPAQWEAFRPHNTSLTTVRWSEEGGQIETFDDYRHLVALTAPANASTHPRGE